MKYIIGIDGVGRGPLAGPVTVSAVAIPENFSPTTKLPLRDSKKLSPAQRKKWEKYLKNNKNFFYVTSSISPKKIDRINISKAANLAATEAFQKLIGKIKLKNIKISAIFLDGGLYLNNALSMKIKPKTVIKGDEKINAVKLASIIAKNKRDGYMLKIDKKFPLYGFKTHKGYGTKNHLAKIAKYGPSPIHRLTFTKKYTNVKFV